MMMLPCSHRSKCHDDLSIPACRRCLCMCTLMVMKNDEACIRSDMPFVLVVHNSNSGLMRLKDGKKPFLPWDETLDR